MGHQLFTLLPLCMIYYLIMTTSAQKIFNVVDYGAVGDGNADDTYAFSKAWNDTCNFGTGSPSMVIPGGKIFLLSPWVFKGPCKTTYVNVMIQGTIIAPNMPVAWKDRNSGEWLAFEGINGLTVNGPGLIDGRGSHWWDQSCKRRPQPGCTVVAPTALRFSYCNKLSLYDMNLANGPQTHILVSKSVHVRIINITIKSPGDSPNTDGIHLSGSRNVYIFNSNIQSGDDCVSIGDYNSHVLIDVAHCGPGHGISIGSLGKGAKGVRKSMVDDIVVRKVDFVNTTNGARIKTWQGGNGVAQNIIFSQISFTSVKNPIIIDQNYCNRRGKCKPQPTAVHVRNVTYRGLIGTSSTKEAMKFDCSQAVPCDQIMLDSISITPATKGEQVLSICNNAYGSTEGPVHPPSCLK